MTIQRGKDTNKVQLPAIFNQTTLLQRLYSAACKHAVEHAGL